jgi:hypothetical protein
METPSARALFVCSLSTCGSTWAKEVAGRQASCTWLREGGARTISGHLQRQHHGRQDHTDDSKLIRQCRQSQAGWVALHIKRSNRATLHSQTTGKTENTSIHSASRANASTASRPI